MILTKTTCTGRRCTVPSVRRFHSIQFNFISIASYHNSHLRALYMMSRKLLLFTTDTKNRPSDPVADNAPLSLSVDNSRAPMLDSEHSSVQIPPTVRPEILTLTFAKI